MNGTEICWVHCRPLPSTPANAIGIVAGAVMFFIRMAAVTEPFAAIVVPPKKFAICESELVPLIENLCNVVANPAVSVRRMVKKKVYPSESAAC